MCSFVRPRTLQWTCQKLFCSSFYLYSRVANDRVARINFCHFLQSVMHSVPAVFCFSFCMRTIFCCCFPLFHHLPRLHVRLLLSTDANIYIDSVVTLERFSQYHINIILQKDSTATVCMQTHTYIRKTQSFNCHCLDL